MRWDVSYIYVLLNTITGQRYVGQTTGMPSVRLAEHIVYAHRTRRDGTPLSKCRLHTAIREYGPDAFVVESKSIVSDDLIDREERVLIRILKTCDPAKGYNMQPGGRKKRKAANAA